MQKEFKVICGKYLYPWVKESEPMSKIVSFKPTLGNEAQNAIITWILPTKKIRFISL